MIYGYFNISNMKTPSEGKVTINFRLAKLLWTLSIISFLALHLSELATEEFKSEENDFGSESEFSRSWESSDLLTSNFQWRIVKGERSSTSERTELYDNVNLDLRMWCEISKADIWGLFYGWVESISVMPLCCYFFNYPETW